MEQIYIKYGDENRFVGEINEKVFKKYVRKSTHLFKKLNAWGFDLEVVNKYILPKCEKIVVVDVENKVTYTTTVDKFSKAKAKDYGHGKQVFIPLREFKT